MIISGADAGGSFRVEDETSSVWFWKVQEDGILLKRTAKELSVTQKQKQLNENLNKNKERD